MAVSQATPEFDVPYSIEEYHRRLNNKHHLILVAYDNERPIGFKIGYDRFNDGSFYSWMGSVLPEYRRHGVARALAVKQEKWAQKQGFTSIKLKTRRKYNAMITFAKTFGFVLTEEIPKIPRAETRIIFEKSLT